VTLERPTTRFGRPSDADRLLTDLMELRGAGLDVTEFSCGTAASPAGPGVVRVGVHREGPLPTGPLDAFDILLSADPAAPRPWVGVTPESLEAALVDLRTCVERQPVAAAVAAQVFRITLQLPFEQALLLESLSYSMLLASDGFRAWRQATPARERRDDGEPRVRVAHQGPVLGIVLNRPAARNAFDARMRDELVEALAFAVEDPEASPVRLAGEGPAFSSGGDLNEFGSADDPGVAHLIRTLRSPTRLVHQIRERVTAHLHGACVGAGIEVPAAAGRVTAGPGAFFRLPEVSMGLIPGAGGTASIPRRIGRRRACYMALSGARIDLPTALAWGLVDAAEPSA
jgi:enoyl-CoA hydratase/carnithine racemase